MKKGLIFSFLISLLLSQTASAQNLSTSFAAEPASKNAVAPSIFMYEAKPGTTIEDDILVKNINDKPRTLTLYPADGFNDDEGKPAFKTYGEEMAEIGAWVETDSEVYEFEPQETKKIHFRITIPEGTEEKDYKGGFALEQKFNTGAPVQTALRIMKNIEIKVTQDPQEIPRFTPTEETQNQPTIFFWVTLGIFIASMAYVLLTRVKKHEKK